VYDVPPPLEPLMELSLKEEQAYFTHQEQTVVKQEMMSILGKQEHVVLPKQVPSEEAVLAWNAMFAQPPQQHDLDFAFGDGSFLWMKPPRPDGGVAPPFTIESECDFNPFVIPKPDHDGMDLFLTTSDECDLLC